MVYLLDLLVFLFLSLSVSPSLFLMCQCSSNNDQRASLSVSVSNAVYPPGLVALAACRSFRTCNSPLKAFQEKRTGPKSEAHMERKAQICSVVL